MLYFKKINSISLNENAIYYESKKLIFSIYSNIFLQVILKQLIIYVQIEFNNFNSQIYHLTTYYIVLHRL